MGTILITDASVLINLVASGLAMEILGGCAMEFQVCPDVIAEVKLLRDRETGEEHPIDLEPLFAAGLLALIEPETDEEFELLVEYSALLRAGDGEAMCFALAEARKLPVAIDDERAVRKARRRNPEVETIGTLGILRQWQTKNSASDQTIGELLRAIYQHARYMPSTDHPEFEWWSRCWAED